MVDRNLIREFNISDDELQDAFGQSLASIEEIEEGTIYEHEGVNFDVNAILEGTVVRIEGDEVLIDIGYKSEGIVPIDEWSDTGELARMEALMDQHLRPAS